MKPRFAHLLTLLILIAISSGCSSTRFKREWKKPIATAQQGMEGRWEGTWLSGKNGHTGKLRCIVEKEENGGHNFHFYATYWKFFSGAYETSFQVQGEESPFSFEGTHQLPKLFGGVYSYTGTATDTDFTATYECRIDHGTFNMTRVQADQK